MIRGTVRNTDWQLTSGISRH